MLNTKLEKTAKNILDKIKKEGQKVNIKATDFRREIDYDEPKTLKARYPFN